MNPETVGRGNPSAGVHIYVDRPTIVLLTISTEHRQPWLAQFDAHEQLRHVWREAQAWLVSDYVLMPDHLHCFAAVHDINFNIEQWIKFWKSRFAKLHMNPAWHFQSRGWHHRLRDDESYSEKWQYVRNNPVRKGLVKSPEEWPYQGRIHDVRWSGPMGPQGGAKLLLSPDCLSEIKVKQHKQRSPDQVDINPLGFC